MKYRYQYIPVDPVENVQESVGSQQEYVVA
jgi:hypothetical protein